MPDPAYVKELGLDLSPLRPWLAEQGLPATITAAEVVGGGSQNVVIRLVLDDQRVILRHPPLQRRAHSDRAISRERRFLQALQGSGLPVPAVLAGTEDLAVLGAAFYLMEEIDGFNPNVELPEVYRTDPSFPERAGVSMAATLGRLGSLDPDALCLSGEGKPEGFLQRQIDKQLALHRSFADVPGYDMAWLHDVEETARLLTIACPRESPAGITHGDYQLNNVLLGRGRPDVVAVLDWEMATIGDPLLDLAWLLHCWPGEQAPSLMPSGGELARLPSLPARGRLVETYAEHSTRDLGRLDWYAGLTAFKFAVLFETSYLRALEGKTSAEIGEEAHGVARELSRDAALLVQGEKSIVD